MSTLFVDTSALGRRYLAEIGSAWVLSWIAPSAGNVIVVSELCSVELFSAFARRQRDGTLSASDVLALQSNFLLHLEQEYLPVALEGSVLARARTFVNRYPLRTLDAIQLACAVWAVALLNEPLTFISGDNHLLAAAAAEGFTTDTPLAHP